MIRIMKKILCLLLVALTAVLVSGCVKGEDDIFDGTATERMTATLEEYRKLLVDSEYGWALDYYTQKKQSNRGTTILCRFHGNGTVDIASIDETNVPARQVATSEFEMLGTQGPVLSINEYNQVLHYYCEPSTGNVEGLQIGDYEFVLLSSTGDVIILKGKKWSNYMIMTRLKSADWDSYFDAVSGNSAINNYIMRNIDMTVNNTAYESYISGKNLVVKAKSGKTVEIAYTVTNEGLRFCKYFEIDGVEMRDFTYNAATEEYVCSDPGVNAKISIARKKEQYNTFLSGYDRYPVSTRYCSPSLAQRFEAAIAGMAGGGRNVSAMYMGYSQINSYLFTSFVMPYYSTANYNSIFKMDIVPVEGTADQVAINSWTDSGGLNTSSFLSRFRPIFDDMVGKSPYTVADDGPAIVLRSNSDPDFVIGLLY